MTLSICTLPLILNERRRWEQAGEAAGGWAQTEWAESESDEWNIGQNNMNFDRKPAAWGAAATQKEEQTTRDALWQLCSAVLVQCVLSVCEKSHLKAKVQS